MPPFKGVIMHSDPIVLFSHIYKSKVKHMSLFSHIYKTKVNHMCTSEHFIGVKGVSMPIFTVNSSQLSGVTLSLQLRLQMNIQTSLLMHYIMQCVG